MFKVHMTLMTVTLFILLGACNSGGPTSYQSAGSGGGSLIAPASTNFKLSLTDAPNDDIQSVIVNVSHAELRIAGAGKEARVIVAENLGPVDLMQLRNGVTLPMADISLPASLSVTQIRLVLEGAGNYIIKKDSSRCDLKTPSEQKTGIKMLIHDTIIIENGYNYSVVADFDALKSIVLTGNGGCLLKPVLKLKSASKSPVGQPEPTPSPSPTPSSDPTPTPTPTSTPPPAEPTPPPDVDEGWDTVTDQALPPTITPSEIIPFFQ